MKICGLIICLVVSIISIVYVLKYLKNNNYIKMFMKTIIKNKQYFKSTIDIFLMIISTAVLILFIMTPKILEEYILTNYDDATNWISFYGSYLGGIFGGIIAGTVTLYVLKKNLEINQKTNAIQVLPTFSVEITTEGNGIYGVPYFPKKRIFGDDYAGISDILYVIKLKNIGVGAALNLHLKKIYTDQDKYYIECERPLVEKYIVAKDQELEMRVNIGVDDKYDIRYWYFVLEFEDAIGNKYEETINYMRYLPNMSSVDGPKNIK